jgi:nucleotide-binding universal stress UspA family protein
MSTVHHHPAREPRASRATERGITVVGYDGSSSATAAVRWAARHAAQPGARLVLVHARPDGTPPVVTQATTAHARAGIEDLWMHDDAFDGLDVELRISEQPPATALARIASQLDAESIVVGRHHSGSFSSDTVAQLLRRTELPVTVVG